MKLTDIVSKEDVIEQLVSTTKEGVIEELVGYMVERGKISKEDREGVMGEILSRESLGSTGIGNGLAIPHYKKSKYVQEVVAVFGKSAQGIDFSSLDGELSYLFFLFISPEKYSETDPPHLKILKKLSLLGRDNDFCRFLREAKSREEIYELIEEIDQNLSISA